MGAQWAGFVARFLVIAGDTAYAANTIGSTDIINGQVKSADIGTGQVQSIDVKSEGLTGDDVADQSGVDTCVSSTTRIGQLCFKAENSDRNWNQALEFCAGLDLRVPSVGEAQELAQTHDLPDVGATEEFWTDELVGESTQRLWSWTTTGRWPPTAPPMSTRRPASRTPTN